MSYSNHRRTALDQDRPIPHRMSHARSCAVHVSQKYRVPRDVVLEHVRHMTGIDLNVQQDEEGIQRAMAALDSMKATGIPSQSQD
jgi:hypothetical protein